MDKKIKLAVVGLTGLLLLSYFIIFQLNSAKQTLERQIEKLQVDISGVTKQLDNLSQEKRRLEENASLAKDDLARAGAEKEELNRKFEMADKARQDLAERLRSVSTQGDALKKQVDSLLAQKRSVDNELAGLKAKHELYQKKYAQMSQMLASRSDSSASEAALMPAAAPTSMEIKAPVGGIVELPPIIVRPKPSAAMGANATVIAYSAKIMAINREDNFVVVDTGKSSGIKIGDRLKVARQGKEIGWLAVIEIRDTISACDIKQESQAFKVGDLVK